ncbi:hypothetical protein Tco_0324108, partial [Tanacetum coccineum]
MGHQLRYSRAISDYDFGLFPYDLDNDENTMKHVSQDIMEEVSLTIDEAKLKKMADEMLRQRCTSGDEHQYHIDQMKNFLKIVTFMGKVEKEVLSVPHPRNTTPYSGPEKIVLSLYKFPAIIFNDDDIEQQTSRWVNKCDKKFNPYARYSVEHWKNSPAKIFYIRKQKEHGKSKEVIYLNSKIIQVIKTYWELGHELEFITEIVARRVMSTLCRLPSLYYRIFNKNDIKDMYLLIMNGKVPDYAETGLLWSLSVFIRSFTVMRNVTPFFTNIADGSYLGYYFLDTSTRSHALHARASHDQKERVFIQKIWKSLSDIGLGTDVRGKDIPCHGLPIRKNDHKGAKDCYLWVIERRWCGTNWNEEFMHLFIGFVEVIDVAAILGDKGGMWLDLRPRNRS